MSRSQAEELIRKIGYEYNGYAQQQYDWAAEVARKESEIVSGLPVDPVDEGKYKSALAFARDKAMQSISPPEMGDQLIQYKNNFAFVINGDVYDQGAGEAPDLHTIDTQTQSTDFISSLAGRSAADALFQRVRDGKATLKETLADIETTLHDKGYDQPLLKALQADIRKLNPDARYITPDVKEAMVHRVLLDGDVREKLIEEMKKDPPTESGKEIAAIFVEHPRVIKNVPDSLFSKFPLVDGREDWMERAAELQPELAIKNQDEMRAGGFKDALRGARAELKVEKEQPQQHGSLIQHDAGHEEEVLAQNVPDVRPDKNRTLV